MLFLNFNGAVPILLILFDILCFIRGQSEDVFGTQEKQILDTILNDRYYDKNFRPGRSNHTGPTLVTVGFEVDRIKNLNDLNMELEMSFTLLQEWSDDRLRFSHLNGNIRQIHSPLALQKIWVPDTYFTNQVNVDHQSSIGPNVHLQIYSDGTVLHTSRITGRFFCPLHFQEFPHDRQSCNLKIKSYGYDINDINFEWRNESLAVLVSEEAFHFSTFNLESYETANCSSDSDEKSCIQVDLSFNREFSHYLVQIYIPCTMMIIISFLSFFLDPVRMATPRTLICLIILVLAVIQISALNATLPAVSYRRAIDIFTGITLTFLFVALVEFVLVGCVCRIKARNKSKNPPVEDSVSVDNLELPTVLKQFNQKGNNNNNLDPENMTLQSNLRYNRCAVNIDRVARIAFPILFIVFIVIYWLIYVKRLI